MNFSQFPNSINQPLQQVQTDYDPYIIKPPNKNVTHGTISRHLVIDSRDRDYLIYPNSNEYRIDVPQEWKDITSLELTMAQIPNTYYNISVKNSVFYLSETGSNLMSVVLPEGQYDNDSLLDSLNGKYGDLFIYMMSKYNFSRNPINLKLRIQCNCATNQPFIFNLNYSLNDSCSPCNVNSIDKTIGFVNMQYQSEIIDLSYIYVESISETGLVSDDDYKVYKLVASKNYGGVDVDFTKVFYVNDYFIMKDASSGELHYCQIHKINNDFTLLFEEMEGLNPMGMTGTIFQNISILMSPNIFNVENKPYVILKIRDANVLNSIGTSNNCFTIIPLLNTKTTIVNASTIQVNSIMKHFNPPMGRLNYLDIQFLNFDGSLFDFRGQENMLLFTVSALNQPGRYNNYVDKF